MTALQSIVSRNVPPLETAVVSVTSIHSGTTFNVIPQTAELQGTIRTFNPEIRKKVLSRFREIATGVADALNCTAEVQTEDITPAVINDPEITHRVQQVAQQLFPDAKIDTDARTMGSEDMAFMMEDIPGCYFFIGSANSARGLDAAHHHPRFDFDESALSAGAALMSAVVLDLLK